MTLTRLAQWAVAGMLLTAFTVHALTRPRPPPVRAAAGLRVVLSSREPPLSVTSPGASTEAADLAPIEPVAEIDPGTAASSVTTANAAPARPRRSTPTAATSISGGDWVAPPGSCLAASPSGTWERMVAVLPQIRELPPDRLESLRRAYVFGSDGCSCAPSRSSPVESCALWCAGRHFQGGRCNGSQCRCFL
ncbi:MAG: hypothetical protein IT372_24275 [Polyangiaceae bacterium]|nr:hypothetical protein [Polyangiaceae bacterium]